MGAIDRLLGNKFRLGKEFEKAFSLFGPLGLSMLGILVVAPAVGLWLQPFFDGFYRLFGIDPSIITAFLLSDDMSGQQAITVAYDERYALPMIIGKVISGICRLVLCLILYREEN